MCHSTGCPMQVARGGLSFESRWPMAPPQSWHPSQSTANAQQFYFLHINPFIYSLCLLFHLFFFFHSKEANYNHCCHLRVLGLPYHFKLMNHPLTTVHPSQFLAWGGCQLPRVPSPTPALSVAVSRGCSRLSSLRKERWVAFCPGN